MGRKFKRFFFQGTQTHVGFEFKNLKLVFPSKFKKLIKKLVCVGIKFIVLTTIKTYLIEFFVIIIEFTCFYC